MPKYAATTSVAVSRTRDQIERTLERYGADGFGYFTEPGRVLVIFRRGNWRIRFVVPMPDPDATEFTRTPTGLVRAPKAAKEAYEQAVRQRWRALELIIKAKLEAVDAQVATFEQEFFSYAMLPGGETVFEATADQVHAAISSGTPTRLMLEATGS